jgi:hypothetical protein
VLVLTVKAIAIWLAILALAVANGVLREAVFIPWLGKSPGLVLSGILLSAVILAVTFVSLPWVGAQRLSELIGIGLGWFVLTLAFELSFGRFQGKSWPSILEAYSFKDGNIWPVVLLVTALAPYLAARLRGWF